MINLFTCFQMLSTINGLRYFSILSSSLLSGTEWVKTILAFLLHLAIISPKLFESYLTSITSLSHELFARVPGSVSLE